MVLKIALLLALASFVDPCTPPSRLPVPEGGFDSMGKGWDNWSKWTQCRDENGYNCPLATTRERRCNGDPRQCPGLSTQSIPCDYSKCPAVFNHQTLKGNCDLTKKAPLYTLKFSANNPAMCGATCNEWDSCLGFTYDFGQLKCYFHTADNWCGVEDDSKLSKQAGLISYRKNSPPGYKCDQATCDLSSTDDSLITKIEKFEKTEECAKACTDTANCKSFLWGSAIGDARVLKTIVQDDNFRKCYLFNADKCKTHMKHEVARYCYKN